MYHLLMLNKFLSYLIFFLVIFNELYYYTFCVFLAKGLTLYQVMAPNAYSYVTGYVSTINKRVESKTHHKVTRFFMVILFC